MSRSKLNKLHRRWSTGLLVSVISALVLTACGSSTSSPGSTGGSASTTGAKSPIIIGAVIDETNTMKPFDVPAIQAAQIQASQINAKGGVGGRKIEFKVYNDQLDSSLTRSDAIAAVSAGASILWVSCDVDYATPAIQVGLQNKLLTIAPCIGTDQMGPSRFGPAGKLAFSFGNAPQSDGAVLATLMINHGWKTATVVTDKLLTYFDTVCQNFTKDFTKMGGNVVSKLSYTSGDHTAPQVGGQAAQSSAAATVLCSTTTPDLPTFVTAVRTLGNQKPIVGPWAIDGGFWEPSNPSISNNIWWATFASVFGDDPSPQIRSLEAEMAAKGEAPSTGGFVTGPSAVQGIVAAIEQAGGSLNGAKLAGIMESFHNLNTISGPASFSSTVHTVVGRPYRIIELTAGKPHFVEMLAPGPLGS